MIAGLVIFCVLALIAIFAYLYKCAGKRVPGFGTPAWSAARLDCYTWS